MSEETMHGGPFDGRVVDVPAHVLSVVFPMIATSTGAVGRNLAELAPEVEFDPETWAITAPPELVLSLREVRYVRTAEGFTADPSSGVSR